MEFTVLCRDEVESGELRHLREPHIVISIFDPDKPHPVLKISGLCQAVLALGFHDACPVGSMVLPPDIRLLQPEQAAQVWDFVGQWIPHVQRIVVHCEQGMSRSPAVAAAIARHLGQDEGEFWEEYQPNQWVYEFLLSLRSQKSLNDSRDASAEGGRA